MILTESPSLFEDTEPIDVKYSNIAREEAQLISGHEAHDAAHEAAAQIMASFV